MTFKDRKAAGEALATELGAYADENPIVYALPRGGIPVAAPIAKKLKAALGLLFVKKIGAPGQRELAIGAIVDGDEPTRVLHADIVKALQVNEQYISSEGDAALKEIERRRALYCGLYAKENPAGRTVIIVDDGLATGATMEVAIKALRKQGAKKIIVAIPVAPKDTVERMRAQADDIISLLTPEFFQAVGSHYHDFHQISDADAMEILNQHSGGDDEPSLVRKRA